MRRWIATASAAAALVLVGTTAAQAQQQVTETFAGTSSSLADGALLGQCNDIVALVTAPGTITAGNSQATMASPTAAAGAAFASVRAMPNAPYVVRASYNSINYPFTNNTPNYHVLAGLYDISPVVQASPLWSNHGLIEVALQVDTAFSAVYIGWWDSNDVIRTWSGTSWHTGASNFTFAFTLTTNTPYEVRITRSSTGYVVRVTSNGTLVTETTPIALNGPRTAPNGVYFATGDFLNDDGHGTAVLGELELPGCYGAGGDAGVDSTVDTTPAADSTVDTTPAADSTVDTTGTTDGSGSGTGDGASSGDGSGSGDGAAAGDGAGSGDGAASGDGVVDTVDPGRDGGADAALDSSRSDDNFTDGPSSSSDAKSSPDGVAGDGNNDQKSGCDCRVGASGNQATGVWLLLLGLVWLIRRRRRR